VNLADVQILIYGYYNFWHRHKLILLYSIFISIMFSVTFIHWSLIRISLLRIT